MVLLPVGIHKGLEYSNRARMGARQPMALRPAAAADSQVRNPAPPMRRSQGRGRPRTT